ncbi:MAG: SIS domain-containing protein [Clostridia bacterium]|nr:SIS domain-containing protein [Clostridia bacterium]
MNAIDRYFAVCHETAEKVLTSQRDALEKAAEAVADATQNKKSVFAFGASHAGLITQELFYRTGGLVTINPIRAPGMMLDMTPITGTSKLERLEGYGKLILEGEKIGEGDLLILHSVSGRNAVAIDMAAEAKRRGVKIVALTNMNTSSAVASRHSSGKKLYDFADILIDNCGEKGDASLTLPGLPEKAGPTSTVVGALILNAVAVRAMELLLERGIEPPVFVSANLDGGDEHNARILEEYRDHIFYM